MKTIFVLLLLPIMAFAQPQNQHQKEYFDLGFSIDLNIESILNNAIDFPEPMDDMIELVVTLEFYIEFFEFDPEIAPFTDYETVTNSPPQYLNTFSLAGLYSNSYENNKPQERLDYLLSLNDARFPKENTLLDFLHPVTYAVNVTGGDEKIAQGFGPLIRI